MVLVCEFNLNIFLISSRKRSEVARKVLLAMIMLGALYFYQSVEGQTLTAPPMPSPPAGFKSAMILLPSAVAESNLKIEVIVGEFVEVDCNRRTLNGTLAQRTAPNGTLAYVL